MTDSGQDAGQGPPTGAAQSQLGTQAGTLPGESVSVDEDVATQPRLGAGEAQGAATAGGERLGRLERGATLGRYVILRQVGRGGMSIVYAAYDPELDRRVAIKVLLPARAEGAAARARLQREAQAIASVSHPNVIAVHDVGVEAGRVFLAMEFVEGRDLTTWAKSRPSVAETLRVYLQAGEGLAAAHRAGLVHRDFKPDNALHGDDGRVRVVDFGLVRRADDTGRASPPTPSSVASDDREVSGTSGRLTVAGALMGTPAYMAPEQFAGIDADERSDQFSFCVALFEAIYGERPFTGDTVASLSAAVTAGVIAVPRTIREAPPYLYRVLARGLSRDPTARFSGMDELLAAIRADPRARRTRTLVAMSLAVGVAVVGWVAYRQGAVDRVAAEVCSGAAERRDEVWGETRVQAMDGAFIATGEPLARRTFDRITADAQSWLDQWETVHREACLATRVRGERSEEMLDVQMACLDGRMRALDSVAQSFEAATPHVVLGAVGAIERLPDPLVCADLDALDQRVRPPDDPQIRQEVKELRDELARSNALLAVGRAGEAESIVERVRARASEMDYLPLRAEVEHLHARLPRPGPPPEVVPRYERAFELGLAAGHDEIAVRAAIDIVYVLAAHRVDLEEAQSWARRADALLQRLGGEFGLEIELASNWAMLESRRGQVEEARRMYEAAIEKASGERATPTMLATLYANLGAVEGEFRLIEPATAHTQRAIELREEALGDMHPHTLQGYMNLGSLALMDRRYEESIPTLLLVLGRAEGTPMESEYLFGNTIVNLCRAYRLLGESDKAVEFGVRAEKWFAEEFGEDSWAHADALAALGIAQLLAKDHERATGSLERALAAFETLPAGDVKVAEIVRSWAMELANNEDPEAGRKLAARWLDRVMAGPAEACALRALAVSLAHREIDLGDHESARRHLELARDVHGFDHAIGREAQLDLRIGWLRLGDHGSPSSAEGRAAAEEIRRDAARDGDADLIASDLDAWLTSGR